jgi:hypothetical protein
MAISVLETVVLQGLSRIHAYCHRLTNSIEESWPTQSEVSQWRPQSRRNRPNFSGLRSKRSRQRHRS